MSDSDDQNILKKFPDSFPTAITLPGTINTANKGTAQQESANSVGYYGDNFDGVGALKWTRSTEFMMCLLFITFTLIVVNVMANMMKGVRQPSSISILRLMGIPVIICAAMCLIFAGFNHDQITSVMGLFGTIAGYLLGRGERADSDAQQPPAPAGRGSGPLPPGPAGNGWPPPPQPPPPPHIEAPRPLQPPAADP